jgi:hypothetical protein
MGRNGKGEKKLYTLNEKKNGKHCNIGEMIKYMREFEEKL